MSRRWIPTLLATAALSFVFGACGGLLPPQTECVMCELGEPAAVWCHQGATVDGMCGGSADIAAAHCIAGNGSWELAEVCAPEIGTETWGNDEPWDPGRDITTDQSTGDRIIDALALDELKRNPNLLFSDASTLEELEDGYFALAASGPLSEALGWEPGDILLDINGYELPNSEAFADAYPYLTDSQKFELTLIRDGREVVLRYRVQ